MSHPVASKRWVGFGRLEVTPSPKLHAYLNGSSPSTSEVKDTLWPEQALSLVKVKSTVRSAIIELL